MRNVISENEEAMRLAAEKREKAIAKQQQEHKEKIEKLQLEFDMAHSNVEDLRKKWESLDGEVPNRLWINIENSIARHAERNRAQSHALSKAPQESYKW